MIVFLIKSPITPLTVKSSQQDLTVRTKVDTDSIKNGDPTNSGLPDGSQRPTGARGTVEAAENGGDFERLQDCSAVTMTAAGKITTFLLLNIEQPLSRVSLRWHYHPGIHR